MARILFLGEIGPGQTSQMRMRALQRLGHDVRGVHTVEPWREVSWAERQIQRRLGWGSVVRRINDRVLAAAREFRPDMVWAEKQEYLSRDALATLKAQGARLVHFTPDPYFSLDWKRTRAMDRAIGGFDVLVYCKAYERQAYEALGKPLIYMPLGYCDEVHRPLPSSDPQWQCTAGFLGGWELRREKMLHAVAALGTDLHIRGGNWDFLHDGRWSLRRQIILGQLAGEPGWRIHHDPLLAAALKGGEVYADDYARALSGARIGLGFLRKVCADQHTTRTFEIPACGSMLLADRTDEHLAFFEEGKEADYFSSQEELVEKVQFYSRNERVRQSVAEAGRMRCESGNYAYVHRLETALATFERQ
jgi:spore maturation protein CgeB